MSQQLNPYITFEGNCAEAMAFYASVLGGEPRVMTFRESGMDADGVMHAALESPAGFHIFAADNPPGMPDPQVGDNLQISLSGDEGDDLRRYWAGLSEGGQILVPLEPQMWGDEYGQLVDKYGIRWHVNISSQAD